MRLHRQYQGLSKIKKKRKLKSPKTVEIRELTQQRLNCNEFLFNLLFINDTN